MALEPKRFTKGIVFKNLSDGPAPTDTNPTCNIPGHTWVIDTPTTQTTALVSSACTVVVACDKFVLACHGLANGQLTKLTTSCAVPTGLTAYDACCLTKYFIVGVCGNDFQVSATRGGAAITLTGTGTGTQTFTVMEEQIQAYLDAGAEKIVTDTNTITIQNKIIDCTNTIQNVTYTGDHIFEDDELKIADTTDNTKRIQFDVAGTTCITGTIATAYTTAKTTTIPDATDTLMGKATTDTMTNKTFDANAAGNSLSNVDYADFAACVIDECLCAVSACHDTLTSAKAVKTYVDAQVTAQDLDFTDKSCTACLSVDLDSQTFKITGACGVSTAGACQTITITVDHDAVCNFVANEHIDHTSVSISSGNGLSGGGTIAATRTLAVCIACVAALTCPVVGDTILVCDCGTVKKATLTNVSGAIVHDCTSGFVANEHIDHTSVCIASGNGLSGGGTIAATRTLAICIACVAALACPVAGDTLLICDSGVVKKATLTNLSKAIDHDATVNFVADEHIAHSGVCIIAGAGMTGGGAICASRTLNVIGTACTITVSACAVTIAPCVVLPGTGAMTVPDGTTAQRPCATTNGMFRYNTCCSAFEGYANCAWGAIGGGSAGSKDIYYQEDFEGTVDHTNFTTGNNATFDNGGCVSGTLSTESTCPIAGCNSLEFTLTACSANDWVKSPAISIDDKQSGNTTGISVYFTYTGCSCDIKFIFYDNTGCTVLTDSLDVFTCACNPTRFTTSVGITSSSTCVAWGFQVVCATACAIFRIDDVEFSTNPFIVQNISELTDQVAYTPTITGFGCATCVDFNWRQIGDSVEIDGSFISGTSTATEAQITLPTGQTIDSSVSANTYLGTGDVDTTATGINILGTGCDAFINMTLMSTANFTPANGCVIASSTDVVKFKATVKITGLSATTESIVTPVKVVHESAHIHTVTALSTCNTRIPYFSTAVTNTICELGTFVFNCSTNGASFTALKKVKVTSSWTMDSSACVASVLGFSLNASSCDLDTNIDAITVANKLSLNRGLNGEIAETTVSAILEIGDVFRPHAGTSLIDSSNDTGWTITVEAVEGTFLAAVPTQLTAYIREEQTSGTCSGTFTACGVYRTRVLNTVSGDTSFVTLACNQITLVAGTYDVHFDAPGLKVSGHKSKLRNITDCTDDIPGSSERALNTVNTATTSTINGRLVLTSTKTFEVQHRACVTSPCNGFGPATGFGTEVYTNGYIIKIK